MNQEEFNSEISKLWGLEKIDKNLYLKLENSGKSISRFRSVKIFQNKKDHSLVAMKKFKLKEIWYNNKKEKSEEKEKLHFSEWEPRFKIEKEEELYNQISDFLFEIKIFQRLQKSEHPNLPKFFGAYYESDKHGVLKNLMILIEAGDFSLKDLLQHHKLQQDLKDKNSRGACLSPEEVILFLKDITPGFKKLKKMGIYHSDIKLENIVYSKEEKKFKITEFGISNIIDTSQNGLVKISSVVKGGTRAYFSPE